MAYTPAEANPASGIAIGAETACMSMCGCFATCCTSDCVTLPSTCCILPLCPQWCHHHSCALCFNELCRLTNEGCGDSPEWQKLVDDLGLPIKKHEGSKGSFFLNWPFNNVRQFLLGPRKNRKLKGAARSAAFVEFISLLPKAPKRVTYLKGGKVLPVGPLQCIFCACFVPAHALGWCHLSAN